MDLPLFRFAHPLVYRALVFHCSIAPQATVFEVTQALTNRIQPGRHGGETPFEWHRAAEFLSKRWDPYDPENSEMRADVLALSCLFYPTIDAEVSKGIDFGLAVSRLTGSGKVLDVNTDDTE